MWRTFTRQWVGVMPSSVTVSFLSSTLYEGRVAGVG